MGMPNKHDMNLLGDLVSIDTTTRDARNYEKVAKLIAEECEAIGAEVRFVRPRRSEIPDGKPRPNLIARLGDDDTKETLALCAHFDALPADREADGWRTDPFELKTIRGKAFGRGTNDDKGGIAAILAAASEAKNRMVNLELFFTCDEEVGSKFGMAYVVNKERARIRSTSAVVIDADPHLLIGTSGGFGGTITIRGRGHHAGYPFLAKNPIDASLSIFDDLNAMNAHGVGASRFPGLYIDPSTKMPVEKPVGRRFSLTMMHAGNAGNNIPNELTAWFDLRVEPEGDMKDALAEFESIFGAVKRKHGNHEVKIALEITHMMANGRADPDSDIARAAKSILGTNKLYYAFVGNDSSWLNNAGIPSVSYGLANDSAHQSNEYVSLAEFDRVKKFITGLIRQGTRVRQYAK